MRRFSLPPVGALNRLDNIRADERFTLSVQCPATEH